MTLLMRRPGVTRGFSRRKKQVALLALAIGFAGSGAAGTAQKVALLKTSAAKAGKTLVQIGKATWYGGKFNGHRTAMGEKFDMHGLTCAHRTLPLGSWIKVTNLHNLKTLFVRVNDRGPMAKSLIVDLSYGAAQKLGIDGVGKVRIDPVAKDDPELLESINPSNPIVQFESAATTAGTPVLDPAVALR